MCKSIFFFMKMKLIYNINVSVKNIVLHIHVLFVPSQPFISWWPYIRVYIIFAGQKRTSPQVNIWSQLIKYDEIYLGLKINYSNMFIYTLMQSL